MTTCYRLVAGALLDLRRDAGALTRRLANTMWPELPAARDGTHGPPLADPRRCAHDWARWLTQPEKPTLGNHEVVITAGAATHAVSFSGSGQLPPLMLDSWPTSFSALRPVIGWLREVASELIRATLPGVRTSPLPSAGWSTSDSAAALLDATTHLGHDRFVSSLRQSV